MNHLYPIELNGITKLYGKKTGCSDVTLKVPEGEIFGFLGPNGAGKSTVVRILTGLIFATSGSARIFGQPAGDPSVKRRIGYLPENFRFYDWMTGMELLDFHASLFGMGRPERKRCAEKHIDMVGLKDSAKYRIGSYSKGMQQRIGLASALLNDPEVLFLDEPTSALDPVGRKDVRDIVQELKRRGRTIFLNSHLLSEVEMVCDSVAIIKNGTVIRQGRLENLLEGDISLEIWAEGVNAVIMGKVRQLDPAAIMDMKEGSGIIRMRLLKRDNIPDVINLFISEGARIFEVHPHRDSLENVFMQLIGRD